MRTEVESERTLYLSDGCFALTGDLKGEGGEETTTRPGNVHSSEVRVPTAI